MNKKWDYDIPSIEVWKECLRVLKPGGHMLVACGTRTQHRMVCNIEDAGFEVRDVISWVYGSGFPKSLNIGKGIDKKLGNEREVIGYENPYVDGGKRNVTGFKEKNIYGGNNGEKLNNGLRPIEKPSKDSEKWEGWGTGLKPAQEFWTLVRKPISEKTIVDNVLKWGTGGINIDKSRIGTEEIQVNNTEGDKYSGIKGNGKSGLIYSTQHIGRFPSNFIQDGSEEVMEVFDKAVISKSSKSKRGGHISSDKEIIPYTQPKSINYECGFEDSGNPSRFFYCAKVSTSERNMGLDSFEDKFLKTMNDGIGNREHNINEKNAYVKNNHPTIKPVKLMSYLCNLITPTNGVILDPFMGSGSTGIAARLNNFNFIGIELDSEYLKIAEQRINSFELYRKFLK
jgi:DNA modification methylase